MGMGGAAEAFAYTLFLMLAMAFIAFLVAFFSRGAARVIAGLTIPVMALNTCGGVQMNMGDITSLLRPSVWTGLILIALVLSTVAVFAPLRIQNLGDGLNISLFLIAFLVGALPVGFGLWAWSEISGANRKATALIAGDANIRFKKIEIHSGWRKAFITEPEMLRFLEDRLRNTDKTSPGNWARPVQITFEGGGETTFSTYWSKEGDFTFYIGMPGEGGDAFGVRLPQPRPKQFDELLEFLMQNDNENDGTVMYFENGETRLHRPKKQLAK